MKRRVTHEELDCSALILSGVDSDNHRIIRVLTEGDRLLPIIALHARRTQRGRGSKSAELQPLSLINGRFVLKPSRDLGSLKRAKMTEAFNGLKGDLRRLALSTTMAEIVLHLVAEHGHEPGVFTLLHRAWSHLNRPNTRPEESLLLLFELRMLTMAGLLPAIEDLGLPTDAAARLWVWQKRSAPYAPLEPRYNRLVAATLERFIVDASGRALKSRPFTTEMLQPPS